MPSPSVKHTHNNEFQTTELLLIFLAFVAIVTLVISVYVVNNREKFYPWAPIAYGGPWNIPTRWPIRGWGWDIRGYPAPYPVDYGYYGYTGGQPAYPAPQPVGSNSNSQTKSDNSAPFGIEMTPANTKPTKSAKSAKLNNNTPSATTSVKSAANNQIAQVTQDETAAAEFYAEESKWWPDWVSWPWMPYFNYGLHYDVNGKLKKSDNESIPANHSWAGWWW